MTPPRAFLMEALRDASVPVWLGALALRSRPEDLAPPGAETP